MLARRELLIGAGSFLVGCKDESTRWTVRPGGIPVIRYRGAELTTGNGAYIIGSCDGRDSENNIWSVGAEGNTNASSNCAPCPFVVQVKADGDRTRIVYWSIGPLPVTLKTLSVPLDLNKAIFHTWAVDEFTRSVKMGCGPRWNTYGAKLGAYHDIANGCEIPGVGMVGQIFTEGATWIAAYGNKGTVTRTWMSGDPVYWAATNHPGTNNLEAGLIPLGKTASMGRVLSFLEAITLS